MKVCFKTADGLLSLDDVPITDDCLRITRHFSARITIDGDPPKPNGREYERTVDRLAGVPFFEEVL